MAKQDEGPQELRLGWQPDVLARSYLGERPVMAFVPLWLPVLLAVLTKGGEARYWFVRVAVLLVAALALHRRLEPRVR